MKITFGKYASLPGNTPRLFGRLRGCCVDVPAEVARILISEGLAVADDGKVRILDTVEPVKPRLDTSEPEATTPHPGVRVSQIFTGGRSIPHPSDRMHPANIAAAARADELHVDAPDETDTTPIPDSIEEEDLSPFISEAHQ